MPHSNIVFCCNLFIDVSEKNWMLPQQVILKFWLTLQAPFSLDLSQWASDYESHFEACAISNLLIFNFFIRPYIDEKWHIALRSAATLLPKKGRPIENPACDYVRIVIKQELNLVPTFQHQNLIRFIRNQC